MGRHSAGTWWAWNQPQWFRGEMNRWRTNVTRVCGCGRCRHTSWISAGDSSARTWPGGVELSFGQWQKLALARGFMRGAPLVLILDEPTAALDAETEHALFER